MKDKDVQKKIKEVEILAYKNEQRYGGCSQCVLGAIKEVFGFISDDVFKAGSGLAGGLGLTGDTCGALIGGMMAISACHGREFNNFEDPNRDRDKAYKMVKKLRERFLKEYGSTNCYDIQRKLIGKSYNLWDKKDMEKFEAAGGHYDKCPSVCGKAARWTMEIILEYN